MLEKQAGLFVGIVQAMDVAILLLFILSATHPAFIFLEHGGILFINITLLLFTICKCFLF